MLINAAGQIIEKLISKIAAGSHFEFWPLAKLAHTFARNIPANFLKEPSKITNPCRNLYPHSAVTEMPDMTQLLPNDTSTRLRRMCLLANAMPCTA